jgi:hypothetical protein
MTEPGGIDSPVTQKGDDVKKVDGISLKQGVAIQWCHSGI